jgi:FAD/FMN-containing dehydrogenase
MAPGSWNREVLETLAGRQPLLLPPDAGYSAYTSDVVLDGHPDAVLRPRSESDVGDIVAVAASHAVPLTVAGGQTSVTGSSVAEEGILLATEGMDRFLGLIEDPQTGQMTAVAEPGIFLGDFQRALETEGWFYPPDPTSRNEARLGATVATNATGEDTLLYGPTRRWVRELRVVTTDGGTRILRRTPSNRPLEEKATPGYYRSDDEIDLVIGSEGTLGVVTRITVDVVPLPPNVFTGLSFFPSLRDGLEFVVAARRDPELEPRALELIDRACLDLVEGNPEGITWPESTGAAIVFKQEYRDEKERASALGRWFELVGGHTGGAGEFQDRVLVVEDRAGRERVRSFRHRIPSTINEVIERFKKHGGRKVGTDWWVPYADLPDFLETWRGRIREAGLRALVFGHVGNGHPHVNFISRTAKEGKRAEDLSLEMCQEAVARGGGVAGEHGLGKLKRNLLAVQYSAERIEEMRDIKRQWDPGWILGRGNLFTDGRS